MKGLRPLILPCRRGGGGGVMRREKPAEGFVFQRGLYIFTSSNHRTAMDIVIKHFPEAYQTPTSRVIDTHLETSFLASNLEPIEGGDDPDIDW